jgi:hypothetical protein
VLGAQQEATTMSARSPKQLTVNIDTDRLAKAPEEIEKAIKKIPPEITIKFFR